MKIVASWCKEWRINLLFSQNVCYGLPHDTNCLLVVFSRNYSMSVGDVNLCLVEALK